VWNATATKGDLTAVSRWLDSDSKYVNRRMTYNTLGQLLTSRDETNRPTTTVYETTTGHSLFPATVTNSAGETTSFLWDPSCAAITSTTDPNSQVTGQTYDLLCRASRTSDPLGGYVQLSYQNLGTATTQRTRTETKEATGVSGADWSEDYFDGLGRTYKSLKRGPSAAQTIVGEKTFNARGGVATSTEPYYADASPASFRVTSYEYDAADRIVRTELPDGNDVQVEYLAIGQTTTDPNG
jgi:YD repeat-containing protein